MKYFVAILFLFSFLLVEANAQNVNYYTITDLEYRDKEQKKDCPRCILDIYYPDTKGFSTLIYFHGGGLKSGEKEIPDGLKNNGVAVIAPNYSLYPTAKAPVYIQDASAAVAWVFNNIEKYGGNPDKIFISGHSAGGYLASMIGLDKSYLAEHEINANDIAGLIPLSGHTITHFTVREEMGIPGEQPIIDKYAPLYHVRKDSPPLLLITGDRELELLGRYEENAYMMRMMKVAGHTETRIMELDGYGHGMVSPALPLIIKEMHRVSERIDNKDK